MGQCQSSYCENMLIVWGVPVSFGDTRFATAGMEGEAEEVSLCLIKFSLSEPCGDLFLGVLGLL